MPIIYPFKLLGAWLQAAEWTDENSCAGKDHDATALHKALIGQSRDPQRVRTDTARASAHFSERAPPNNGNGIVLRRDWLVKRYVFNRPVVALPRGGRLGCAQSRLHRNLERCMAGRPTPITHEIEAKNNWKRRNDSEGSRKVTSKQTYAAFF